MSNESYNAASVSEALAKINAYRRDFGDWILTATSEQVLERAKENRDEANSLDDISSRKNMLLAKAVQLEAIAGYIAVCDLQRATLAPDPLTAVMQTAGFRPPADEGDLMRYNEEQIIEQAVALTSQFGIDVILLTPDEWRKMALDALTSCTQGTILDVMDRFRDAIQFNHIARVRQRAEDLGLDLEEHVNPPQLSLAQLRTPPRQPKFTYGDTVYERITMHMVDEEGQERDIETVSEAVVIGISQSHDQVRYRLGNLIDGDVIYPMDDFVPEESLQAEPPVLQQIEGKRARPSFLSVVK